MHIKIPIRLLNNYSEKPSLKAAKTIALWALLRKAYSDNTIRNYKAKLNYLSQTLQISDSTLRSLTKELIRQGYARMNGANLCLTPDHTLTQKDCKINTYHTYTSFKDLTTQILSYPVTRSIKKQLYNIREKIGKNYLIDTEQKHKRKIGFKTDRHLAKVLMASSPTISNSRFALMNGTNSVSSGFRLKKRLREAGIIADMQRIYIHAEINYRDFQAFLNAVSGEKTKYLIKRTGMDKGDVFSYLSSSVYLK